MKNIVLILCDQQARRHVGCYGNTVCQTPHLDRLAASGMRFDNAYTTYPVCTPARGAMMCGLYPESTGAYSNELALYETVSTIGERFGAHGYKTGYIGKWHLDGAGYMGGGLAARGFPQDYWYDGNCYRKDVGEEVFARGYGECNNEQLIARDLSADECWGTRATDRALSFLESHAGEDAPFLLVVSYDEPHPPACCPKRFVEMYDIGDIPAPATVDETLENKPAIQRRWRDQGRQKYNVCADTVREGTLRYYACNTFIDEQIGRLLDGIDRHAVDTVVAYTTDHGDFGGAHGLYGKGPAAYEEITGVPLLIRAPGVVSAGSVTQQLASTVDLIPTLQELGGLAPDADLHGVSLCPTLTDPQAASRDAAFMGFTRFGVHQNDYQGFAPMRAVRSGQYKLALNLLDRDELYDLAADPAETDNRIDDPALCEVRDSLHARLCDHMETIRDPLRGTAFTQRFADSAGECPWG